MNTYKVYVKKDKLIADVKIINFQDKTVQYVYSDIDIEDLATFNDVEFMKSTGKTDLLGNPVYEGHVLYQIDNFCKRMIGIRNFNANGSCPFKYYDKLSGIHQQDRISWLYVPQSIIIGTVWDDLELLKIKADELSKKFKHEIRR